MKRILISKIKEKVSETVKIAGWVDVRRDHGKLIFIDLRDASGKVQIVAVPKNKEAREIADTVRPEWVIEVEGEVKKRPDNMVNPDLSLGDLEILVKNIVVLNESKTPPFEIGTDGYEVGEEIRLKYRYLDLRRERLRKNLQTRHNVVKFIRDYLSGCGFMEVETPILTKSTPEGARDFVVPSRLQKGKFYALPQSPQQYKQLLMAAGVEKYFQIAKAMRDEDTRGDRQPEFTQLDVEMSFAEQEDILNLAENLFTEMVHEIFPKKKITKIPWPRIDYDEAIKKYGTDSPDLRKDKNNPNELAFAWIINFPLFEEKKENGHFAPSHHMFTSPVKEDLKKLDTNPHDVRSYQYDISLNGLEISGGSIRIHNSDIQSKIFDLIGFGKEQKEYFNHMLTAFKYGIPPHGGIAAGVDRLVAILQNEPNIREVIAFPKTGDGRDLMMDAPSEINKEQLSELGIEIHPAGRNKKNKK